MNDAPTPLPEPEPAEPYSLPALLADVYAAPGDVFDSIKNAPVRAANWLIPLILLAIIGIIYMMAAFSQPGVVRATQEMQEKAMQQKVAAGKMTQAQADQATKVLERFVNPTTLKIFGAFNGLVAVAMSLFLFPLLLWLAVRFVHRARIPYMKVVEASALAGMIDVLQKILRSILVVWKGNMLATVSPTFFLANPSLSHRTDVLLSILDPIDFWWVAVLSLGLSKVASVHYGKAALWVGGLWFGFRALSVLMIPS